MFVEPLASLKEFRLFIELDRYHLRLTGPCHPYYHEYKGQLQVHV